MSNHRDPLDVEDETLLSSLRCLCGKQRDCIVSGDFDSAYADRQKLIVEMEERREVIRNLKTTNH